MAIDRCPYIKRVTLKTCDDIMIAIWGLETYLSYKRALPWVQPKELEKSS